MSQVPQRAMAALAVEPEELVARLSESLERTISFAEECRWRFPELSAEADQLAQGAMALFGKTMRLAGRPSPASADLAPEDDTLGPLSSVVGSGTVPA